MPLITVKLEVQVLLAPYLYNTHCGVMVNMLGSYPKAIRSNRIGAFGFNFKIFYLGFITQRLECTLDKREVSGSNPLKPILYA